MSNSAKQTVLVTGGAGFIGSNIVEALLQRNYAVRVLDNFSTGSRANLAPFEDDITIIEGDLRSYHIVRQAVDSVDYILHQGALPSVPRSIADPVTTNEVNAGGTLNILHAAVECKVKRVVYASSSSIYGNGTELPKRETMTPVPLSPYAVSKLAGEKYCSVFAEIYGIHTVAFRYFNVFGPKQNPNSQYSAVIPKFINLMMQGDSPVIFGDGEQSRDFTFVSNVVNANLLALEKDYKPGSVFNCATHRQITVNQMVQSLNEILGTNIQPQYKDARPGDVKHSFAGIDAIQDALGYHPGISFNEGLGKTVEWFQRVLVSPQSMSGNGNVVAQSNKYI